MTYGPCCAGDGCTLPDKTVTFAHKCVMCQGYLHVICGFVDANNDLCCKTCILKHAAPVTPTQEEPLAASTMLSPIALCAICVPGASARNTIATIDVTLAVAAVPQDKTNKGKWSASLKKTTSRKKQKSTTTDAQMELGNASKLSGDNCTIF
jgi:hypothetical protein